MALIDIAADDFEEIIPDNDTNDYFVRVIDGAAAFLNDNKETPPSNSRVGSGQRLIPGDSLILEAKRGVQEILHAADEQLTVEVNRLEVSSSGPETRVIRAGGVNSGGGGRVARLARVLNNSPGANTNVQDGGSDLDVTPPQVGSMIIEVVLATGAVFNRQVTVDGTTIEADFNEGVALTAGSAYTFTFPCRPDATYNYQVESAVEIDYLEVDFTSEGSFG